MNESRLFHQLAAMLLGAGVLVGVLVGWLVSPRLGAAAGLGALFLGLLLLRRAVVGSVPARIELVPTSLDDHPWLDRARLEDESRRFEALGFAALLDFELEYSEGTPPPSAARLLVHPEELMYVEIGQVVEPGGTQPVASTVGTFFEEGWRLQTTSRRPTAVLVAFLRAPRSVWRSLPEADPATLVGVHRQERQRMCAALGIEPQGSGAVDDYIAAMQAEHADRLRSVRRTNVGVAIVRGIGSERQMPLAFLGEYRAAARG